VSYIREQQYGYRRGLVLGLTMAEIVVLVIFVLLLVLGVVFARQVERVRLLEEQLDRIAFELSSMVSQPRQNVMPAAGERDLAGDPAGSLVIIERELNRLRQLEHALEEARPADTGSRPLPEVLRELTLLREAVVAAGISPTPKALREALDGLAAARSVLSRSGRPEASAVVDERQHLIQENRNLRAQTERLARENRNLRAQMANLRRQARTGGRGLDHPPCWATPEGKPEYIFDVTLTNRGLILRDRALPHRVEDRKQLPIDKIVSNTELTPKRFLDITEPLFKWSIEHECRFVVRVFDETGAAEKATYKHLMRILEQRFYKYEVIGERF